RRSPPARHGGAGRPHGWRRGCPDRAHSERRRGLCGVSLRAGRDAYRITRISRLRGAIVILLSDVRIGIIGLGYVGLPLAVEFGKRYPTVGFDIKPDRVAALKEGRDVTRETTPEELRAA